MESENYEILQDRYSRLILKSIITPKYAVEISKETKIPLSTVYRRLEDLKNTGFLKISGYIENGVRVTTYQNKRQKYHKSNPRILLLLKIIRQNPGIHYRDIQKISGYPHGTLTHSLANLEKDSQIKIKRTKRRAYFFPIFIPAEEFPILINLRKETSKRIILFLLENKKGTFSEIRNFSSKSPSTISITLTNLIESKVIRRVRGLPTYFEIEDAKTLQNAVNRIEPSITETIKDRFADTFSYF